MDNINLLKKLISLRSITSDKEIVMECLSWCRNVLKEKSIESEIVLISKQPLLTWGCDFKKAKIMINTHVDVVPGDNKLFNPRVTGNRIFGRGSADTKGFVSCLLALDKETIGLAKTKGITFVLVPDEEIGGSLTKELLLRMPQLKFAIFGEPTNLKIINLAKGIMQVKITAIGKSCHGSRLWLGKNAIEIICRSVESFIQEFPIPAKETNQSTINFSLIKGGSAINQVPDNCELLADVRINPSDSPDLIIKRLKKHFSGCKIEILKSESPIKTDSDNNFVKQFGESIKNSNLPVVFNFDHGSSDARHCTKLNIPAIVFGPVGGNLHQNGEWVNKKSLLKVIKVIKTFIKDVT